MADVGAKVQANSKAGEETVGVQSKSPSDGETLFNQAPITNDEIMGYINQEAEKLPGSQENIKNINWLGGSYSGADIKVVAHIYEPSKNEEHIARIEEEMQVAEKIRDGCTALLSGGISTLAQALDPADNFQTRREMFLFAADISSQTNPVDEKAARFLVRNIYTNSNWNSFLGLAKITRKTEQIKNGQAALAQGLSDRLKAAKEVSGKGLQTVVLATLQTLSVQSHREKYAVRALGHSYVKGYTRGPRTIAGSMIFTIFNEHALAQLTRSLGTRSEHGEVDKFVKTLLPDQLPPIDLTVVFANEYGSLSEFRLFGVEFLNDGATYSIEDLMSENVINFVARDVDPMTSHDNIKLHRAQTGLDNEFATQDLSGSQLLFDDEGGYYKEYLERLRLRRRLSNR